MIRLFKHYVPRPLLALGLLEALALLVSIISAWVFRVAQISKSPPQLDARWPEFITFTITVYILMLAVGLYHSQCYRSVRMSAVRLTVALALSLIAMSLIFFIFPDVAIWRSVFLYAIAFSYVSIMVLRYIFTRLVGWQRFRRRVLVLGSGRRAQKLKELAARPNASFAIDGFLSLAATDRAISDATPFADVESLADHVAARGIEEIVLALEERRGALPVQALLAARLLGGARVMDLPTFLERETGRVDLESLNLSWMIFSDGFVGSHRVSALIKRTVDMSASAVLLLLSAPILVLAALAVRLSSPGPVLYRQSRVGQFGRPFDVLKFRSMRNDAEKDGTPQWAQAADPRVTPVGRFIRSTRIDEIPQIFNVFRGDMSFVGPRPERPFFVDDLAQKIPCYSERHVVKPGITGWAQLNYPYGASMEDARHKLEYDLYYVKNYTIFLDLLILIQTVRVVLWQDGVR